MPALLIRMWTVHESPKFCFVKEMRDAADVGSETSERKACADMEWVLLREEAQI